MNKPLILQNAVKRKGDEEGKIFTYDNELDINIVLDKNKKIPFIELGRTTKERELVTKTKVNRERDDEENMFSALYTKTEVERERDDEENYLIELMTKTFVDRERDDEDK